MNLNFYFFCSIGSIMAIIKDVTFIKILGNTVKKAKKVHNKQSSFLHPSNVIHLLFPKH